jgi:uncharacterized protein (TIGR00297 family)
LNILEYLFHAPTEDWLNLLIFFIGIFCFILLAEKTRKKLKWPSEVNRKLVHILTGILIFFSPFFITSKKPLIWIGVIFIMINYIGIRSGKLMGIHDTERRSYGTVFYPMTFLILILTCWDTQKSVILLSMLILALADAAAAIVGENLKSPHEYRLGRDKKSFEGSSIMFIMSFLIVLIGLPLIDQLDGYTISWITAAWIGFNTAVIATVCEAISSRGSDNLSTPLGAAFVLSFMLSNPNPANVQLSIGIGLALLFAVAAFSANFLTANGSITAFLLAVVIFGIGGWKWAVPILTFFTLSSLISKIGGKQKSRFGLIFEKKSRRDMGQVLANGGVAGSIILLNNYFPNPVWYILYLGSLAAVNSDTWATEIGVLSKRLPRSIKNFKNVPPGTSGGITGLGLGSGFLGALIIALSSILFDSTDYSLSFSHLFFYIIVLGGFLAGLVDSLLGATIQAQYRCPACKKVTEKQIHCNKKETVLISGYRWLNNDMVNFFCSVCGGLFVWIMIQWLIN